MGYSGGNVMRKWTTMPSHSLFSVPWIFPCHSLRFSSFKGDTLALATGHFWISNHSFIKRLDLIRVAEEGAEVAEGI
jgi:hypothetical protein